MEKNTLSEHKPFLVVLVCLILGIVSYLNLCTGHHGKLVTREEYGKKWAFTVPKGYVYSIEKSAIFETESGHKFQLNGIAQMNGYKLINPIWRNNPEIPETKVNIGPFIKLALETPI